MLVALKLKERDRGKTEGKRKSFAETELSKATVRNRLRVITEPEQNL